MTEVRRIHISGLGGQFSRGELERRLAGYGEVLDFDGCEAHHVDAVGAYLLTGNPRKFAFATLRTTPAQLAKCMNTLSGVLWKGARLRVSEAKPQWDVRLEREREKQVEKDAAAADRAVERRKKWLRRHPWVALEAHDMSPVTKERVQDGEWGWHLTPAGHLVRPMRMRPERPIPGPSEVPRSGRPRSRASRIVIDPTRYTREHLTASILGDKQGSLEWEFHDGEWVAYDHRKKVASEPLCLKERIVPQIVDWGDWVPKDEPEPKSSGWADMPADDAGDDLWAGRSARQSGAGLFDSDEDMDVDGHAGAEDDDDEDDESEGQEGEDSENGDEEDSEDGEVQKDTQVTGSAGAAEGSPITLRPLAIPDEESDFSDGYDEMQAADTTSDEHSRAHSFLTRLFGKDAFTAQAPPPVHVPVAKDNMDDLDTDAPPSESETAESAPTHAPADDELPNAPADEPSGAPADEPAGAPTDAPADAPADDPTDEQRTESTQPGVHMERLKDMFQPSADSGAFSLFDGLDLDLGDDPLEDAPPPMAPSAPMVRTVATLPFLTREPSLRAALHRNCWTPFWATEDDAAIEARWTEKRAALTQGYKRIHREALKKRRRRVVGSRANAASGGSALRRDARST